MSTARCDTNPPKKKRNLNFQSLQCPASLGFTPYAQSCKDSRGHGEQTEHPKSAGPTPHSCTPASLTLYPPSPCQLHSPPRAPLKLLHAPLPPTPPDASGWGLVSQLILGTIKNSQARSVHPFSCSSSGMPASTRHLSGVSKWPISV